MNLIALSQLLSADLPLDRPIAVRQGLMLTLADFRHAVAGAIPHLVGCRRVAIRIEDGFAFAIAFFATLSAGATVVLLPGGHEAARTQLAGEFDRLIEADLPTSPHPAKLRPLDAAAAQVDFFTSGSTGTPKRVTKTLAMLEREVAVLDGLWGDRGTGPVFATVPHQHLYGLMFKLLWPLSKGRPFESLSFEVWEPLVERLTAQSLLISSPAHLSRLGGLDSLPTHQRPAQIFSAAAPLPWSAAQEAKAVLGQPVTEIFGSTETGAFATRQQVGEEEPWQVLPGVEIMQSEDGCLALRTPYQEDAAWQQTADRIALAPGGFRALGRVDRIAKIEGKRIDLTDVEAALTRLPWVLQAATLILPPPDDRLAAILVLSEEGTAELAKHGAFRFSRLLRQALAPWQEPAGRPRRWRFVAELPTSALGKRTATDLIALFGPAP